MPLLHRQAVLTILTGFILVVAVASPSVAQTTALYFESQPGDYVGSGLTQMISGSGFVFSVIGGTDGLRINVNSDPFGGFAAVLDFKAPSLAVGSYEIASGVLDPVWFGVEMLGHGCDTSGRFTILEREVDDSGNITRFAADFEQHCENRDPALIGAIRYNSAVSTLVPFGGAYPLYRLTLPMPAHGRVGGAGLDCGGGGTVCSVTFASPQTVTLNVTPQAGWLFTGWTGRCEGYETSTEVRVTTTLTCGADFEQDLGGQTSLFIDWRPRGSSDPTLLTFAGRRFAATRDTRSVTISTSTLAGAIYDAWSVWLSSGDRPMTVGTYYTTVPSPATAGVPALRVLGSSVCDGPGRFVVREAVYDDGGSVLRFAADFECTPRGQERILWGAVRYHSTIADYLPFGGVYPEYRLSLVRPTHGTITGGGLDCGPLTSTCSVSFPSAATVSLSATPDSGYLFAGWTLACAGGTSTAVDVRAVRECGAVFQEIGPARSLFTFGSAAGHYVGQGRSEVDSPGSSAWNVSAPPGGSYIRFDIATVAGGWQAVFGTGSNQPLALGTYVVGEAIPGFGFLSISGDSRSCEAKGRVRVLDLGTAADGSIIRFAADFEHRCPDSPAALFGAIRYHSAVGASELTYEPTPGMTLTLGVPDHGAIVAGGSTCDAAGASCVLSFWSPTTLHAVAVPNPGYLFMGWVGECAGPAATDIAVTRSITCSARFEPTVTSTPRTVLFWESIGPIDGSSTRSDVMTPANSAWTVTTDDAHRIVTVRVQNVSGWTTLELSAPENAVLAPGTYPNARASITSRGAGLQFDRGSGACVGLTGRFVIRELVFGSGATVERLAADFERECGSVRRCPLQLRGHGHPSVCRVLSNLSPLRHSSWQRAHHGAWYRLRRRGHRLFCDPAFRLDASPSRHS